MIEILTKHNISFNTDFSNRQITVPVIYSRDYLSNELLDLNLARLCCTLCCAGYDEKEMIRAFQDGEFTEIKTFYTKNEENSASFAVAKRDNIYYVVIRGTRGEEWYNNFRTGVGDTHQGYYDTVCEILPVISKYAKGKNGLVLTGHSRGGALCNLLAAELIKDGRENIFAYTFACPNVTTKEEAYSKKFRNIHNFVYEEDFITHCPLEEWGYSRYGNTVVFRSREINYRKLKKTFNELTGMNFISFKDCNKNIDDFKDTALRLAASPYEYYNKGYLVDEEYISLYDYFLIICDLFNDKNTFEAGITLLATKLSEFAPISNFLVSGTEMTDFISQGGHQNSCGMFAHSCLTYLCLLDTQKIKAP